MSEKKQRARVRRLRKMVERRPKDGAGRKNALRRLEKQTAILTGYRGFVAA